MKRQLAQWRAEAKMALEFRDGKSLVVQADLPDLDPEEDLEIWVSHDVLHIRARAHGPVDEGRATDLREGVFARDLALPPGSGSYRVQATYGDGRLEVRAPVDGTAEPADRRVTVTRR